MSVETPADLLGIFIRVMDSIQEHPGPMYAETCCCGASIKIDREVPTTERRRAVANFLGRHQYCARGGTA